MNEIESKSVVKMYTCSIKVDEHKNIQVQMLVREQKILHTHLKRRTDNLGTYVAEFLTFTSVVKTYIN